MRSIAEVRFTLSLNIMKTSEEQSENPCPQCPKKQQLLHKYTNLIELLKKKNEVSNNSFHLKQTANLVNNNSASLLTNHKLCRALLALKLLQLEQKGKKQVFEVMRQLVVQQKCHKGFKMALALDRCIGRRTQEAVRYLWINKNKQLSIIDSQSFEKSNNLAVLDTSSPLKNVSCLLPGHPTSLNEKTRNLSRKLFVLSHQITSLNAQKKALLVQIDENMRRQEIESKKKKQSLQMLGEEMAEKNELIAQLQQTLQFYEAKLGKIAGNVLEDDSVAIKKELEALEKVNEKINIQLEKRGEQLSKCQAQVKSLNEKNLKLQAENVSLKQKNFELALELQGLQQKKKDYYSLSSFLQRKISSLKKYEKLISNNLKALEQYSLADKSSFNNSIKPRNSRFDLQDAGQHNAQEKMETPAFSPISCFEAQYKIEKILNFIFNVQLQELWIKNDQKLFDNEEMQVLNGLKLKFIQLNDQLKALSKPKADQRAQIAEIKPTNMRLSQQYGQSDEVYFNRHHISGSIFEVLGTQKNNKEKENDQIVGPFECISCQRCVAMGQTTSRKGGQNLTIRLLELQLQKSKQVEKIAELKNKLMHIRCIVMNFIKSLDTRAISKQAREIIDIFCQFFEYSEEEKQAIYQSAKKEKKFMGWF